MSEITERQLKMLRMAEEILRLSRSVLLVKLRFMDAALSRLELVPMPSGTLKFASRDKSFQDE